LFNVPGSAKSNFLFYALIVCGECGVTSQFSSNWKTPFDFNAADIHELISL
jgi:hypothetical protein